MVEVTWVGLSMTRVHFCEPLLDEAVVSHTDTRIVDRGSKGGISKNLKPYFKTTALSSDKNLVF